jgi:hypothetical protein
MGAGGAVTIDLGTIIARLLDSEINGAVGGTAAIAPGATKVSDFENKPQNARAPGTCAGRKLNGLKSRGRDPVEGRPS